MTADLVIACNLCNMVRPTSWEGLHAHQGHMWITINEDSTGSIRSVRCAACTTFQNSYNAGGPCPALIRIPVTDQRG